MAFFMALAPVPNWRLMLVVISVAFSLTYLLITVFYMTESPRWLVSKGRRKKAETILKRLCGREDVSGELALLYVEWWHRHH
ncbi:hypothetical protein GUJ93_ZPchr0008g11762 [Zizania palustris]|uniref:Major facilitator superfamily (MFS) profile domain-containing protein n=1 Tax=Zizania palustris TaxID=103762 RepID=A0A8J5VJT7_ZIZPA|nr:hypothetical protein GUJ93_ZPchr0008g11762 [Zizania palustris]